MRKIQTSPYKVVVKNEIELALEYFDIKAAKMPAKRRNVTFASKVSTLMLVMLAIFIVAVYVGIPLSEVAREYFTSLAQDSIIAFFIIAESLVLMLAIIMNTDGWS